MADFTLYAYSLLTVGLFAFAIYVAQKLNSAIFNSFILALLMLVAFLLLTKISFTDYYRGNAPLNQFLSLSVVALAVPLYERLPHIRRQWKAISLLIITATLLSMISGLLFGVFFGASLPILASLLPKSVTTAMAVVIAEEIGGSPALSSVGVIVAGVTGSAFGYSLLRSANVSQESAIGLSVGAASHALGTARLASIAPKAASYASVALVMCGILSSLIAPLIFRLAVWLFYQP